MLAQSDHIKRRTLYTQVLKTTPSYELLVLLILLFFDDIICTIFSVLLLATPTPMPIPHVSITSLSCSFELLLLLLLLLLLGKKWNNKVNRCFCRLQVTSLKFIRVTQILSKKFKKSEIKTFLKLYQVINT
jgi:hypothetical protein